MTLTNFAINLLFAGLLLLINGWIGRWKKGSSNFFGYSEFGFNDISEENFSDNFFQVLIHPAIYLAILGSILQALSIESIVNKLNLVIPLYWMLRLFIAILCDTACFLNWRFQFLSFIASFMLGEGTLYFVICPLLEQEKTIFIDLEQFRDSFWFAVFCFIAKYIWEYSKYKMIGKEVYLSSKKEAVIIQRYEKYHKKFNPIIEECIARECTFKSRKQKDTFVCLVYAIMIYEAHNRPFTARVAEYIIKFFFPNKVMSLGIMQFQTDKYISSNTSILLAVRKLYKAYRSTKGTDAIDDAIFDYNPSMEYSEEVCAIYYELKSHLGLPFYNKQIVRVKKRRMSHKKITQKTCRPVGGEVDGNR